MRNNLLNCCLLILVDILLALNIFLPLFSLIYMFSTLVVKIWRENKLPFKIDRELI